MPGPLFDSEYLYGLHDPGGEHHMQEMGTPGWVLFTEKIGRDPNDRGGGNYTHWANQNYGVMVRLNHGYQPEGTIPRPGEYANFARRCANFVAASPGCKIWIIGNEMNYWVERPGANTRDVLPATRGERSEQEEYNLLRALPDRFNTLHPDLPQSRSTGAGEVITPELYARCYRLCREAIHQVQPDAQVLIGSVAPWNNQTTYPGNERGDWVQYMSDILRQLGPEKCDGITLHTYTHAADPNQVHDAVKMGSPFQDRHYNFRTYQDFMQAVPANMRHLPAYITEADQDVAWENRNLQWVQRAYGEINHWNQQAGHQQIRALVLYRWPNLPGDRWQIQGKASVIEDFKEAMAHRYRWRANALPAPTPPAQPVAPANFRAGTIVLCADILNLRRSPGFVGKGPSDVASELPAQNRCVITGGPQTVDNLIWWAVRSTDAAGRMVQGWLAQTTPDGAPLLQEQGSVTPAPPAPTPTPPVGGTVNRGDHFTTVDIVNLRRSPGFVGKIPADVVSEVPANSPGVVMEGPQSADGLVWWRVSCLTTGNQRASGWMAQADPTGRLLMTPAAGPVPTPPPPLPVAAGQFQRNQAIFAASYINVRKSPGYVDKSGDDVVGEVAYRTPATILDGPRNADDLVWWQIRSTTSGGQGVQGWAAEKDASGMDLLTAQAPATPLPPTPAPSPGQTGPFKIGDAVANISPDPTNARRSPGYAGKPPQDVAAQIPSKTSLNLRSGPRQADDLYWWQVSGQGIEGWMAEAAPNGVRLMGPAHIVNILRVGKPFVGNFPVTQFWGGNADFYRKFTYDGVALKGHNGIDFGTPVGTQLIAADSGTILRVDYEPNGFGNYILMQHRWGESVYAHLDRVHVKVDQTVNRGDVIGSSGNTGASTGPHLHFSIRINPYRRVDGWGGFADPASFMDPNELFGSRDIAPAPTPMGEEVPGRPRP